MWIWSRIQQAKCKDWLSRHGFLAKSKAAWQPSDQTGLLGEEIAAAHLESLGYRVVARNFKRTWGEIDLIAIEDETVVYVEVKTRFSRTARPELAVTAAKRKQLIRLAQSFAAQHGLLHQASRFDIVAVNAPQSVDPIVKHFKNAFRATSNQQAFTRFHQ